VITKKDSVFQITVQYIELLPLFTLKIATVSGGPPGLLLKLFLKRMVEGVLRVVVGVLSVEARQLSSHVNHCFNNFLDMSKALEWTQISATVDKDGIIQIYKRSAHAL
jgi:hypothetical protein